MRTQPDRHLAHALYSTFVAGDIRLSDAARRAGMSVAKLYSLCEGTRHPLAKDVPGLFRASGNSLTLLSTLIGADDCGVNVSTRPVASESLTNDGRSGALKVAAKAGELSALVDSVLADGVVTGPEFETVAKVADALESQVEALRSMLKLAGPVRSIR